MADKNVGICHHLKWYQSSKNLSLQKPVHAMVVISNTSYTRTVMIYINTVVVAGLNVSVFFQAQGLSLLNLRRTQISAVAEISGWLVTGWSTFTLLGEKRTPLCALKCFVIVD